MIQLLSDIRQIIADARRQVYRNVNITMVQAHWLVGKRIVEEEQNGLNMRLKCCHFSV